MEEEFVIKVGCKKDSNVNKYENRTAGMFYIMRPCGIRISHAEMYTAESISATFLQLIDTFSDDPSPENLSGIVYDRACDLHRFISRLDREGSQSAKMYSKLSYIVDVFHAEKHSEPCCDLNNELCLYHPDLPQFADVRKMNMEIAEQTFHIINPLKHITRNMTYAKRLCLLKIVDDDFNNRLLLK